MIPNLNASVAGTLALADIPAGNDLLHVARLLTIGELSASFAQEIASPLMLIRGHICFMNQRLSADDPLRLNLEIIDRATQRMEDMSRRILDFSKKRDEDAPAPPPSCSVAEVLEDSLRFIQPRLSDQNISTRTRIASGLPPVAVNRWQLVQGIVNMLQNAAEAMAKTQTRLLSVSASLEEGAIRIAIGDTGRGIADSDLPQMFMPFFTTKEDCGTGLGLYVTGRIVEEIGGEITVQTGPLGTTFVISIPLHQ